MTTSGTIMTAAELEAARVLQVCNACRYCEGFCAVFPAMTRRLDFGKADLHYLANLCHNCTACLHACQYAAPHEFAIDVPRAFTQVRRETYVEFAWPPAFSRLYRRSGVTVVTALVLAAVLILVSIRILHGSLAPPIMTPGDPYAVVPHGALVAMFGLSAGWSLFALAMGLARFWRAIVPGKVSVAAGAEATHHALALTYLGGGHGKGCNERDDAFTLARRRLHHFTFYGFLLCFAATCVASVYHYVLDLRAPYPVLSLPVILGTVGGIAMLIGTAGLLWLNIQREKPDVAAGQRALDRGFILILFLLAATGLLVLAARASGLFTTLLIVHLAVVLAFFLTLPYSKFVHWTYRCAALLKAAVEKRLPRGNAVAAD